MKENPSNPLDVRLARIQPLLLKKLETISNLKRPVAMEEPSMTVALEKTVLCGIFAVAKGADVTATSVTPILVQPFALITTRKYVRDF
jgi:hypothetical protein